MLIWLSGDSVKVEEFITYEHKHGGGMRYHTLRVSRNDSGWFVRVHQSFYYSVPVVSVTVKAKTRRRAIRAAKIVARTLHDVDPIKQDGR